MATQQPSLLFLILLLSSILTIITSTKHDQTQTQTQTRPDTSGSSKSYIRVSCRATLYPSLCYQTLSRYSSIIQHNPKKLTTIALALSLSRARATATYVSKLSRTRRIRHRDMLAIIDCLDNMLTSVDQLTRSMKELGRISASHNGRGFKWRMSNVQTWVSAALTNENTCVDGVSGGYMDGRIKGDVSMRVGSLAQLTSNALALVNRFASRPRTHYHVVEP